ncbi:hypothetical protein N185_30505 [Sinorhizobium sp. GW3]|nr:hypothetical protein N185_30505 [Sinorhizobium sp. GW3]
MFVIPSLVESLNAVRQTVGAGVFAADEEWDQNRDRTQKRKPTYAHAFAPTANYLDDSEARKSEQYLELN